MAKVGKGAGMRFTRSTFTICLCIVLGGCFQAQLKGSVSGATVTVSDLRDTSVVYAQVQASSRSSALSQYGETDWEGFGARGRLWLLGIFFLDVSGLEDERLYLLTASGGADADANRDGEEDAAYTPVVGSWHAIVSGAQLKRAGPKVSTLTEAVYQWLAADLQELDDAQLSYNLQLAATQLVADVNRDSEISADDIADWSRLFNINKLLVDPELLDQLADNVTVAGAESDRRELSRQLVGLDVDSSPRSAAGLVREQLLGLSLEEFFAASYRAIIQRHPEWIVEFGLEADYGDEVISLNNISDSYSLETFDVIEVILEQLRTYDRPMLEAEQQLSYDVYEWYLNDWLAQKPWLLYNYPASSFITDVPRQTLFYFTDVMPLATAEDARRYLARLDKVGIKFEQLRDNVAARAEAGIIEPRITLDIAIDNIRQIARTRATSTDYYRRLTNTLGDIEDLSVDESLELRLAAQDIIENKLMPAYQEVMDELLALQDGAPETIGFGQFEGGDGFYAYALRHHTTTEMTAADVHQMGLDELQRLHGEIRTAATALGYNGNLELPLLFQQIEVDGGTFSGSQILLTYENILDLAYARLSEAFDVLPQQQLAVIGDTTGGFYVAGSADGSRPGAFYAQTVGDQPYYRMRSLAYHEGVPGHHMQIALAQEQSLPDFRRYTHFTAFVEGWALYAEHLAGELNWYENDPYGELGRLQFEAIRAARLVVDTGIHAQGWSWDEAVSFYQDNTGSSFGAAQGAAARFMRLPGQATAYMVGMNQILALRAQLQVARGENFELREFHNLLLTGAAMPMTVLAGVVEDAAGD
jgi:uncharacterized protein (DUF885 family)